MSSTQPLISSHGDENIRGKCGYHPRSAVVCCYGSICIGLLALSAFILMLLNWNNEMWETFALIAFFVSLYSIGFMYRSVVVYRDIVGDAASFRGYWSFIYYFFFNRRAGVESVEQFLH